MLNILEILENKKLPITSLVLEQGIYPRITNDWERVEMFNEMYQDEQCEAPPIVVAYRSEDNYVVIDGVHRYWGAKKSNIDAVNCEIAQIDACNLSELTKWAGVYNCTHGKPLTRSEIRAFVKRLYEDGCPTTEIAKLTGIPYRTAAKWTEDAKKENKRQQSIKIQRLTDQGLSQTEIAKELNLPKSTISDKIRKIAKNTPASKLQSDNLIANLENEQKINEIVRGSEETRRRELNNTRDAINTIASLLPRVFKSLQTPSCRELTPIAMEAFFSENSEFAVAYKNLSSQLMDENTKLQESRRLIGDVKAYLKKSFKINNLYDNLDVKSLGLLLEDVGKELKGIHNMIKRHSGDDANKVEGDSRIRDLCLWYNDLYNGLPPENNGKGNEYARIAKVFKGLLRVFDALDCETAVDEIKRLYTEYKNKDEALAPKQYEWLFDGVRSIVQFQGKLTYLRSYLDEGDTKQKRRLTRLEAAFA